MLPLENVSVSSIYSILPKTRPTGLSTTDFTENLFLLKALNLPSLLTVYALVSKGSS